MKKKSPIVFVLLLFSKVAKITTISVDVYLWPFTKGSSSQGLELGGGQVVRQRVLGPLTQEFESLPPRNFFA